MITALAAVGWALAAALGWRTLALRGRLHSVADAEHELRGSITAFALVLERPRGATAADSVARALESELARARAGLEVLAELAAHTQVLFFTHHARLVELAREVLPAARLQVHELDRQPTLGLPRIVADTA